VRSGEIKALTGLRIVAAVWVVLFHFRPMLRDAVPGFRDALAPVLNCGAQGVDLFFILSGFVLTWNYLDRMGGSWSMRATVHFLWLRLARVWPVYLVTLHLAALWVIFTLHVGHVPWQDLAQFNAICWSSSGSNRSSTIPAGTGRHGRSAPSGWPIFCSACWCW
jgi:peptidoglycan/LPS O-acetylase OafA/YrhL